MDAPRRCAHCGQPAPAGSFEVCIDGAPAPVCCAGCAAAAQWIERAGLDDYYRLRSERGPRPDAYLPDYTDWQHPDVVSAHVLPIAGGVRITVITDAMRCAACAWLIDRSLRCLPGVLDASANAVTGRITMDWDPAQVGLPALLTHLHRLGFTPHLSPDANQEAARRAARRRDLMRLGVAGLGAMQAMMLSEAVYLDGAGQMPVATRDFFRWFTFFASTPVVFFSGWPFLAGLWRDLCARHAGMDALVGGSILVAYAASFVETVRGGPQVWFDAAVMFVLLLLAARQIEQWARWRAREQVDLLARAQPVLAMREADGSLQQVPAARLRSGDVVRASAGQAIPADGVLLSPGQFDEALLTGEPRPVARGVGDTVLAGSTCGARSVRLRVTQAGSATYLSMLQRLVTRAQAQRPRLARLADGVAAWFVAAIFVLAAGVFLAWWQVDPPRAFPVALAVLVVSCPCALSLALPAALAAAHARLARNGVLAVRPDALETLARVDTVLTDKTGTLTQGSSTLASVDTFAALDATQARAWAAALQRGGAHPLASAFADVHVTTKAQDVHAVAGRGIEGRIDGRVLRLGDAGFAAARADDGAIWLGDGHTAMARFVVEDALRTDARGAVRAMQQLGLHVEVSSGDAQAAVQAVVEQTGIASFRHRQSPALKLERARELQRAGHVVAMIGDGINDAPVLAGADVSFAFGGGAASAHASADFVLTGDSLSRVPETIALARRTRRIVRQNLAWAVGYNLLALPFAALGQVEPWAAALGMTASSLAVTLNALRLRRDPPP